jgi:hypothetical protein
MRPSVQKRFDMNCAGPRGPYASEFLEVSSYRDGARIALDRGPGVWRFWVRQSHGYQTFTIVVPENIHDQKVRQKFLKGHCKRKPDGVKSWSRLREMERRIKAASEKYAEAQAQNHVEIMRLRAELWALALDTDQTEVEHQMRLDWGRESSLQRHPPPLLCRPEIRACAE